MTERELFEQYREEKSVELRNEIAEKYLYIAEVLAKKFVGRGVEYDDLYQVAALALIKGIDRFDASKGLQFSTFITPTITGEIKNYFRDRSRLVHLPRKVTELRGKLKIAQEELTAERGRRPTAAEIAERLGASEEEVLKCMEAGGVLSIDNPSGGSRDGSFHEVLPDTGDVFEELENRDAVLSALKTLSEEERKLVSFRFGEELTQEETAGRMGVSQMSVSRMERKILQKLRETLAKSMVE